MNWIIEFLINIFLIACIILIIQGLGKVEKPSWPWLLGCILLGIVLQIYAELN